MAFKSMMEIQEYVKGNRLKHSLGVHMYVQYLAREEEESVFKMLTLAALYHDIGYAKNIERKGSHHALDGYLYAQDKVSPLTAYLILRHTGAEDLMPSGVLGEFKREEAEARKKLVGLGFKEDKIEEYVDMVTLADIRIGCNGKKIEPLDRLEYIRDKYGEKSVEYISLRKEIVRLKLYDFKD